MDAQSEACPVCLRKRTRQEIFAGLRGEKPVRRASAAGSGFKFVVYLLVGGAGLAYAAMQWPRVMRDLTAPPKRVVYDRPPPPQTPPPQETPSTPHEAPPSAPDSPAGVPSPKKGEAKDWLVRGAVFDLLTLAPLGGVAVSFIETGSGESVRTKSDAGGRFELRLPKDDGAAYKVALTKKGYRDDFLEDSDPSFRVRDLASRRSAAREMDESAVLHVPVSPPVEDDEVELSYALIPVPRR
jgi:hypothetical protein